MSRFKVGDLALVVSASQAISNIGKCVELVRFVKEGDKHGIGSGNGVAAADLWVISGDNVSRFNQRLGIELFSSEGLAAEKNLMPLRGEFSPETARETELTK